MSRITHNKVDLRRERIDLRIVLQSAIDATAPTIDAHGLSLTLDLPSQPLWADADFTRLAQAFSNLLNNSAKYSERGGQVRVSAAVAGGLVTIVVTDTGVGIPPSMLPRIFDMFTQLQAHRDRTHGGLGIGLTLAKRLVELHGGTITASSGGAGLGSTFTVRLPQAAGPESIETAPVHEDRMPHSARRILIAEDNPDAAEMMRVMLTCKGHEVKVAVDGEQAVRMAKAFEPQIAFLDIGMPRMDGYEAARQIREHHGSRMLLVALTGWGQDDDKRRSREAGFDHHLTKPAEPEMLDRLIEECPSTV